MSDIKIICNNEDFYVKRQLITLIPALKFYYDHIKNEIYLKEYKSHQIQFVTTLINLLETKKDDEYNILIEQYIKDKLINENLLDFIYICDIFQLTNIVNVASNIFINIVDNNIPNEIIKIFKLNDDLSNIEKNIELMGNKWE